MSSLMWILCILGLIMWSIFTFKMGVMILFRLRNKYIKSQILFFKIGDRVIFDKKTRNIIAKLNEELPIPLQTIRGRIINIHFDNPESILVIDTGAGKILGFELDYEKEKELSNSFIDEKGNIKNG